MENYGVKPNLNKQKQKAWMFFVHLCIKDCLTGFDCSVHIHRKKFLSFQDVGDFGLVFNLVLLKFKLDEKGEFTGKDLMKLSAGIYPEIGNRMGTRDSMETVVDII